MQSAIGTSEVVRFACLFVLSQVKMPFALILFFLTGRLCCWGLLTLIEQMIFLPLDSHATSRGDEACLSPGLFHVHIDFLRFLFLTEFHRWISYNFLWPVFHEVSSFLTLRLNNVLVKLFSFFSLLTDPWMNMMICSLLCLPRWTSFFGSYTDY